MEQAIYLADENQLFYDIEVPISVNTVTLTANISPTAQHWWCTYHDIDQTKVITFFDCRKR